MATVVRKCKYYEVFSKRVTIQKSVEDCYSGRLLAGILLDAGQKIHCRFSISCLAVNHNGKKYHGVCKQ